MEDKPKTEFTTPAQDVNIADKIRAMNQQASDSPARTGPEPEQKQPEQKPDNTGNKVDFTGNEPSKDAKVAGPPATAEDVKVTPSAGKTERQAALEEAQKILKKHGGLEGNIPLTSPYWALMNTYRTQ